MEHDAVVIGSGAGGGAIAYALTRAGLRVLMLERGPHYTERDFIHDELTVCRRGFFVPNPADDPHVVVREGRERPSAEGWIACCVGGGTVHMSGYFFRMHAEDFREWPIALAELAPFYDEVEKVIGVSGEPPLPLGPMLSHPASLLVEQSCRALGMHAFQTPRAILSSDYRGRSACSYCGFCGSYGCEVGAKSSSLASFLALASRTGKLTLKARSTATLIEKDGRAVQFLDEHGKPQRVSGRVVIAACSAIETARLLLESGIANSSGLVGKNLMFSTLASGYARFARPSPHFPASSERLPFIDRTVRNAEGTILFQRPHVNPIFQAEKLARNSPGEPPAFGAELKKRLREFFHETHTIEWEAFSEFLPHAGCSVSLSPTVKDKAGRRSARVEIAVDPASLRVSDSLAEKARAVLSKAGATKQGSFEDRTYSVLQCGTARMGNDPAKSVVDRDCRSHDVPNLYVADSSSFVSSGSAPFTLTIMANALRVGASIAARAKRRELPG